MHTVTNNKVVSPNRQNLICGVKSIHSPRRSCFPLIVFLSENKVYFYSGSAFVN
jgi:hypothetical protein